MTEQSDAGGAEKAFRVFLKLEHFRHFHSLVAPSHPLLDLADPAVFGGPAFFGHVLGQAGGT